jgi:CheY-like chemotaxis protein
VDAHDSSPTLIEGQNTALPKLAVLLVEDNPVNQQFMSTLLSKRGHVVTIANNGQEAVEVFREEEFDIILMDIQMPVMGGDEATRLIRKLEPNGSTPIIAVSAHALPEERERILRGGANAFVLKPIKVDQLLGVMASVLSVD